MKYLKYLATLSLLMLPLSYSDAEVRVGVGVGFGPGYVAGPPYESIGIVGIFHAHPTYPCREARIPKGRGECSMLGPKAT